MSDALITVGTTPIFSSPLFDNDATVWPNDTMLLDEWADIDQLWLNESGLTIEHRTDGRSSASFVVLDSAGAYTFYERQQVIIEYWDGTKQLPGAAGWATSPNLKDVFQELIDSYTYSGSTDIMLLLRGSNDVSAVASMNTYDTDPTYGAYLEITYR